MLKSFKKKLVNVIIYSWNAAMSPIRLNDNSYISDVKKNGVEGSFKRDTIVLIEKL